MAMIWITHDLGVVAELADWVAVMYGGFIVESAGVDQIFESPQHPYTLGLLACLPQLEGERRHRLPVIPGQPPSMKVKPRGCPFEDRCGHAFDRCKAENPPLMEIGNKRRVACWWDLNNNRERSGA
jgi:oligopeptide/dipeptide ABC transporter ATP-binding protein